MVHSAILNLQKHNHLMLWPHGKSWITWAMHGLSWVYAVFFDGAMKWHVLPSFQRGDNHPTNANKTSGRSDFCQLTVMCFFLRGWQDTPRSPVFFGGPTKTKVSDFRAKPTTYQALYGLRLTIALHSS